MERREFITLIGGAAVASSVSGTARAQQRTMPVIGLLASGTAEQDADRVQAFRNGLSETGYVEGRTVAIEYRWGEGRYDRMPELAADLVRRQVSVIGAIGGIPGAQAAKAATATIPIVFVTGANPVEFGLVASLARPGGNITGVTTLSDEVAPKRLELLHELLPTAIVFGLLVNPTNPNAETQVRDMRGAARALGLDLHVLHASTERNFEEAFASLAQLRAGGLVIGPDTFYLGLSRSSQLVILAARHALPTISFTRDFVTAGGLMSYGSSAGTALLDSYRTAGVYAGRILKGEKPADLPVQQATRIELAINMRTAKVLGLTFPTALLVRADEAIE